MEITETLYVKTREEWRNWLAKHHKTKKEIWFIFCKKATGKPCIPYDDSVEEAICFGWIDGIRKKLDDERYAHRFTPRNEHSVWSIVNKKRAEKMMNEGRMTEAGLTKIEVAKKTGVWSDAYGQKTEPIVPSDLKAALLKNKKAWENWTKFANSYQNRYIRLVLRAKTEETRKKKINEIVKLAEQNRK